MIERVKRMIKYSKEWRPFRLPSLSPLRLAAKALPPGSIFVSLEFDAQLVAAPNKAVPKTLGHS
jgi:hypothetical protein